MSERDWFFVESGKSYEILEDETGGQALESEETIKGKNEGDTRVICGNLYYISKLCPKVRSLGIPDSVIWRSYDPDFYVIHHDNME